MNSKDIFLSSHGPGLRAWQASFVESFLQPNSAPFHLLAAPTGLGKMYTSVAIASELIAAGARRILVLVPATLCEAWAGRLVGAQSNITVTHITRRGLREIEAGLPPGDVPWSSDGVYVVSQDFAKQSEVAAGLAVVSWDLVIVDEAHRIASPQRTALIEKLVTAGVVRRLLLLSATPLPALDRWLRPSNEGSSPLPTLELTSWFSALTDWDGSSIEPASITWKVVGYERSSEEMDFVGEFLDAIERLQLGNDAKSRLIQTLFRRLLSSSLFALEGMLRRLLSSFEMSSKEGDEDFASEDDPNRSDQPVTWAKVWPAASISRFEWRDKNTAQAIVKRSLQDIEKISSDKKLEALKQLIGQILSQRSGTPRICICSGYSDTITYLHSALDDLELSLFKITGGLPFAKRQDIVERLLAEGGIILATHVAMSEGIVMADVDDVVHYDVPPNLLRLDERLGPFVRFDRRKDLTMYVLRDESGVFKAESKLIDLVASLKRPGERQDNEGQDSLVDDTQFTLEF